MLSTSAPLDLAASARRIGAPDNRFYERRFLRKMRERLIAYARYQPADFAGIRSLIEIDNRITAPAFGMGTAENYYRTQSAIGFVDRIRVPTLLIQAKDDTFVPWRVVEHASVCGNPHIQVVLTDHGGHLGFVARGPRRFWLDAAIPEWIGAQQERAP